MKRTFNRMESGSSFYLDKMVKVKIQGPMEPVTKIMAGAHGSGQRSM